VVNCRRFCTPGMGVNLWGVSPLYMNPVNMLNILTKILAEGKPKIPSWSREAEPRGFDVSSTERDRSEEAKV
jgi:hypothetical protein